MKIFNPFYNKCIQIDKNINLRKFILYFSICLKSNELKGLENLIEKILITKFLNEFAKEFFFLIIKNLIFLIKFYVRKLILIILKIKKLIFSIFFYKIIYLILKMRNLK